MAIFPILQSEPVVRSGDKIRLSGSNSFISKAEADVTSVLIEAESGSGFIEVFQTSSKNWFLDWVYSGVSRTVTATVSIATDGAPVQTTLDIDVKIEADDVLFSNDDDMFKLESDLYRLLPDGKSSFIYSHRKAKESILDWLNENGRRLSDGSKVTEAELLDLDEVRKWSESIALKYIFENASNSIGDKFDEKARKYDERARDATVRSSLRLDLNKDGNVDLGEEIQFQTLRLRRR